MFKVGYAKTDITPQLGIDMPGYFKIRDAEGVLDPLDAVCVAFSDGETTALVITADSEEVADPCVKICKDAITAATGVPAERIFISATHAHTGGDLSYGAPHSTTGLRTGEAAKISEARTRLYCEQTATRMADAATFAIADLKPATLSCARSHAPRISFGRRYLMKDGRTLTNPGVLNPDIVRPVGSADDEVQVLRIDREGADPVAVLNFQTHPDTVGGAKISADWPGFVRRTFESALGGAVRCLFLNGTQGDVNHVCVDPKPGELNGMRNDFDNVYRGYDHARHMGAVVAGAALQVWYKCAPLEAGKVRAAIVPVKVPSNMPTPEEMPEARRIDEYHRAGRDAELPYSGMELTTAVAAAARKISLEHGPAFFELPLSAIAIGDAVAFCGFPGEPFNAIGVALKAKSPFGMTITACHTNGCRGYFPFSDAYEQGGYESESSPFGPSVADDLIDGQLKILDSLKG